MLAKAKPKMIKVVASQLMKYQMSENKVKYACIDNADEKKA